MCKSTLIPDLKEKFISYAELMLKQFKRYAAAPCHPLKLL